eukprot:415652_1
MNNNPYPNSNPYMYGRNDTFGTEIDYGDVPENMDESHMRAYLALESKLVMPNQNSTDSFEQQWKHGRQEYSPETKPPQQQQQQPQPYPAKPNYNYKDSQTEALSGDKGDKSRFRNDTNTTNTTVASSVYPDSAAYTTSIIDRNSQVTMIPQKNMRTQHSFRKQPINKHEPQHNPHNINHPNPHNRPAKSALTAQIAPQKQQLANQNDGVGVIQSRNGNGLLVIKQMPYSKKTHVCLHIFVEIKPDHIEHIIVYFQKHFSVQQFLDLLKNKTNNAMFKDHELQIFCADDEGDLDDDFPSPETTAIIANLGLTNFYIKLANELNDEERDELRRTTIHHKKLLSTEQEMDERYNINEEDDESESSYEDED